MTQMTRTGFRARTAAICILLLLVVFEMGFAASKPAKITVAAVGGTAGFLAMNIGETAALEVLVAPAGASTGKITWKSSKKSVASVSKAGFVSARKRGRVVITATSKNGKKTGKLTVLVSDPNVVDSIRFEGSGTRTLEIDKQLFLLYSVEPGTASGSEILWSSSDKKIATVYEGIVVPKKEGTVKITAKAKIGGAKTDVKVRVVNPYKPAGIRLGVTGTLNLRKGETCVVAAQLIPERAVSGIQWTSSKKSVATVKNGVVIAKKKGKAKITATTAVGKKKASFTVRVRAG